jgi:hypothetical protein
MWVCGNEGLGSAGRGEGQGLAVDAQHGTGVEGSSHPGTEGHLPKLGFFCFCKPHTLITVHFILLYHALYIFLLAG